MATGTTIAEKLMKQDLAPRVYRSFQDETVLLSLLMDVPNTKINARGYDITTYTKPNPSFGSRAEGDYLPLPGSGAFARMNIKITRQFQEEEVTGDIRDMDDIMNIGGLLKPIVQYGTEAFKSKLNKQCYGDRSGSLGVVTAITTGASGTATFDPATTPTGSRYIPVGARLHFYTTAGVAHATGASVSIVTANNTVTGVVTFDNVPTDAVVGDIVVYESSYGLAMNGLNGLIQNAAIADFQGVSTITEPGLKATVYDAAGASWTQSMVDTTITRTKLAGGVGAPVDDFVITTNPKQTDAIRKEGYALTRTVSIDNSRRALDLGFPLVTVNGTRVREDNDCGDSDMYGIRLSSILRLMIRNPGIMEMIEGQMLTPKYGTGTLGDAYYIAWGMRGNLATNAPNANFRIKNLSVVGLG
jgi:hypothetical protein